MNRAKNINAKHAYLLNKASARNKDVLNHEQQYGGWMKQFMKETGCVNFNFHHGIFLGREHS